MRLGGQAAAVAATCVGLAALSLLLPSSPTYDPWAWLVWGREVASLELATEGGPAWKPLAVAITTVLSPFGDAAPELWLVLTRAATLGALALAWSLGRRLGGVPAAAVAVAGLVAADGWIKHGAWGNSEALVVLLVLGAAELHLRRRERWAFWSLAGGTLLRPEVALFAGAYGVWLWRRERRLRPELVAAAVALPLAWALPEVLASGELGRSAGRAQQPDPGSFAAAGSPMLEALRAAISVPPAPLIAGLVLAAIAATRRRLPPPAALAAAAAVLWALVVAGMAGAGFSGAPRFLLLSAALAGLAAGAAWAAALRGRPGWSLALPIAMAAWAAPGIVADLRELGREAGIQDSLHAAIERRAEVRECPTARTEPFRVPVTAWELGLPLEAVSAERDLGRPAVLRRSARSWRVRPCRPIRLGPSGLARVRHTAAANGVRQP